MKSRLRQALPNNDTVISTFHSLCYRIIHCYISEFSGILNKNFKIADTQMQKKFLNESKTNQESELDERQLMTMISKAKNEGVSPEMILNDNLKEYKCIYGVYKCYCETVG